MAIEAVDLFMRRTGEKSYLHAVHGMSYLVLCRGCRGYYKTKNGY